MSPDPWQILSNIGSIIQVAGGIRTVVFTATSSIAIYVARDGVLVPYYLRGAHNHLISAKTVLDSLSEEQKIKIEELRQETDRSLDSIIEEYEATFEKYQMIVQDHRNTTIKERIWPTGEHKGAVVDVNAKAQIVYEDILTTTSRRARKQRQEEIEAAKQRRELERQARMEVSVEEGDGDPLEELPPIPRTDLSLLTAYFRNPFRPSDTSPHPIELV